MSRFVHLKIKIASLAAESRIIRAEEKKALKHGRFCLKKSRERDEIAFSETPISYADFAGSHYQAYEELYKHRTGIVRRVARENLLALGFLRGLPYARIEPRIRKNNHPNFNEIIKHVKKFGSAEQIQGLNGWLDAAWVHIDKLEYKEVA